LSEATDTPELKIAKQIVNTTSKVIGTNPEGLIKAIQSIADATQFWKVNELVKTLNGDKLDIVGLINDEFEYANNLVGYSNRKDLDKITAKLKTFGFNPTIKQGKVGGYLDGTYKINAQPINTKTKDEADNAAADNAAADNAAADNADADKSTPKDTAKKQQEYRQQITTKTSDTTKQIQALLGLDPTGEMDTGLLQKINDKLNGKPQEAPKADVATQPRPQVEPLLSTLKPTGAVQQQLTTQNPEQLAAGLKQMQQKDIANATPPKVPTRDELIAKARADLKAARKMK
jgi:hypothetical protein